MLNWILAVATFTIWGGATYWYFREDISAALARRRERAAKKRAAED